jgi:hypothetical protein
MRRRLKIVIAVLLIVCAVLVGLVVWAETPPVPLKEAFNAMQSDTDVIVTNARWLVFQPNSAKDTIGFIFYPGAGLTTVHMHHSPTQSQMKDPWQSLLRCLLILQC